MIIKQRIQGYNNVLYRRRSGMKFGLNEGTNYSKPAAFHANQHQPPVPPKKVHQPGGNHLDNLKLRQNIKTCQFGSWKQVLAD